MLKYFRSTGIGNMKGKNVFVICICSFDLGCLLASSGMIC